MSLKSRLFLIFLLLILVFFISPSLWMVNQYDLSISSRTFLDRNGHVIGTLNPKDGGIQIWLPLNKIPQELVSKTLQKEDRFFFYHPGVNPFSITRAFFNNLTSPKKIGGSTITQQLAKNIIQNKKKSLQHRNIKNKISETFLALGLELRYSKNTILEHYLNTVYYGNRAYGLQAASLVYFGKNTSDLLDKEMDILVSLPQHPGRTPKPQESQLSSISMTARHFMEFVNTQTENTPLVKTTLDLNLQQNMEKSLGHLVAGKITDDPLLNYACVVIDVKTGDILAMVGSRDYFNPLIDGQYNAALALRQPGSAIKPFTYFTAFSQGYSPHTLIEDAPKAFTNKANNESYLPQNFDRHFHGTSSLKESLANSYNVPAVSLLYEIGLSTFHETIKKFGITSFNKPPEHYGLAITLGSGEVSLLELTNAYAALARGGTYLDSRFKIEAPKNKPQLILPQASLYASWITEILSDPKARLKAFGFNEELYIEDRNIAVKTGTSSLNKDNWTLGYSKDYAVGVWVGRNKGDTALGTTGATGAGPLWHAAMELLVRKEDPKTQKHGSTQLLQRKNNKEKIEEPNKDWEISSPLPHSKYQLISSVPEEHQQILAEIKIKNDESESFNWFLDGKLLFSTPYSGGNKIRQWLPPSLGPHILKIVSSSGKSQIIKYHVLEES